VDTPLDEIQKAFLARVLFACTPSVNSTEPNLIVECPSPFPQGELTQLIPELVDTPLDEIEKAFRARVLFAHTPSVNLTEPNLIVECPSPVLQGKLTQLIPDLVDTQLDEIEKAFRARVLFENKPSVNLTKLNLIVECASPFLQGNLTQLIPDLVDTPLDEIEKAFRARVLFAHTPSVNLTESNLIVECPSPVLQGKLTQLIPDLVDTPLDEIEKAFRARVLFEN